MHSAEGYVDQDEKNHGATALDAPRHIEVRVSVVIEIVLAISQDK
jgi:hypothetical protein